MTETLRAIPRADVNLIQSAQVITCLRDAAKELLENAIDAGAKKVSLKFTNHGVDLLEVTDDGSGVREGDFEGLVAKHATSKLVAFTDLENMTTLGFRGEALSSICALSQLSITTCTKETYPLGHHLVFARDGSVQEKKTVSAQVGTTVRVQNLFSSLPVRRKDFEKNAKKEFISATKTLQAHAAIRVGIRIEAIHFSGKSRTHLLGSHGTTGSQDLKRNICDIFGIQLQKLLVPIEKEMTFQSTHRRKSEMTSLRISGFVSDVQKEYGQRPERQLTYINSRPCHLPKILRTINETCSTIGTNRAPFVLLNFTMPPDSYDVNVSPDKRTILLHDEQIILDQLRETIEECFSSNSRYIPASKYKNDDLKDRGQLGKFFSRSVDSTPFVKIESTDQERQIQASEVMDEDQNNDSTSINEDMLLNQDRQVDNSSSSFHLRPEQSSDYMPVDDVPAVMENASPSSDLPLENEMTESPSRLGSFALTADSGRGDKTISTLKRKRSSPQQTTPVRQSKLLFEAENTAQKSDPLSRDSETEAAEDQTLESNGRTGTNDPPQTNTETTPEAADQSIPCEPPDETTDVLKSALPPLPRFVKRLNNFEHSNPSYHVHQAQVTLNSHAALNDRKAALIDVLVDPTNANTSLQDAGIEGLSGIAERTLSLNVSKSDFFGMSVVGQFNLGFIIVYRNQELFIIDQHASDEKSNYEKLLRDTVIQSQRLAVPRVLELSAIEKLSIEEHIDTLAKNGFEIMSENLESSEKRYMLVALPVTKNITFGITDLLEILHLLMEGSPADSVRCTKAKRMFASRACRSSIMIGTALAHDRMQAVVWHLGEMDAPWNCPHGRPTMRHLLNITDMPRFALDYG